jgi:hypothetical protein
MADDDRSVPVYDGDVVDEESVEQERLALLKEDRDRKTFKRHVTRMYAVMREMDAYSSKWLTEFRGAAALAAELHSATFDDDVRQCVRSAAKKMMRIATAFLDGTE